METLERVRIPPENFCPDVKKGLTHAPSPLPEGIYVKKPMLVSWGPRHDDSITALVLQEAKVYEILKKNPDSNIALCYGCLVRDSKITSLCLTKYNLSLEDTFAARRDILLEEKRANAGAIKEGIRHLHGLGLAHNYINPSNVMMDADSGMPVIIDFDSCRPIREEPGENAGTFEWELEGAELSDPENDLYGLRMNRGAVLQIEREGN